MGLSNALDKCDPLLLLATLNSQAESLLFGLNPVRGQHLGLISRHVGPFLLLVEKKLVPVVSYGITILVPCGP